MFFPISSEIALPSNILTSLYINVIIFIKHVTDKGVFIVARAD